MKIVLMLAVVFFFSACDLFQTQEEKAQKIEQEKIAFEKKVKETKEIQLQTLSAQTQKDLAVLASKKELAKIQKDAELEKIRMQSELEKQKILLEQEKAKALFEQKLKQQDQLDNMELKRYLMLVFGLFVLLSLFLVFYYFKKRREDKLLAYNDNLKKYFYHKENEARVKIADQMLKTIASGNLDKNQENQLISAFNGEVKGHYQQQIENKDEEPQEFDVEINT
jgi:preprotein translocase subunit SecG